MNHSTECHKLLSLLEKHSLTFVEWRRAAINDGVDIRPAAFLDLCVKACDSGFVVEEEGRYRLTMIGVSTFERSEPSHATPFPQLQTKNANFASDISGQGFRREHIFGVDANIPICLERVTLQTGEECVPHSHVGTHTVVYTLSGKVRVHFGPCLENSVEVGPEDCVYIPADVIHWVVNEWAEPMTAIVARTGALRNVVEYPQLRFHNSAMCDWTGEGANPNVGIRKATT